MKKIHVLVLGILLLVVLSGFATAPKLLQAVQQPRQVVSAGNTAVTVGDVTLWGTLGQPVVGTQTSGETGLRQGFWVGVETLLEWLINLPLVVSGQ